MIFSKKLPNIDETIVKLIEYLKLPITRQSIINELRLHPDYPSLLAISDILNQFNILNGAFKIPPEQLQNIPLPFIAHIRDNRGEFILVEEIENGQIFYNNQKLSLENFYKKFDGNVLAIESIETAGEINYTINRRKELLNSIRNPISIGGFLTIAILALIFQSNYFNSVNWPVALISLFKTLGIATSILLLIQSIDTNNPLIQKLCQSGTNKNCTAILSSNAAKVFDWLTWSEIGFFYFFGTWLSLVFNSKSISILQVLAVLNIISLPYTVYSIYYQARIAKQWCVLCCTVQALLWLEFFPLITILYKQLVFPTAKEYITVVICFSIPILLWMFIKPFFLKAQQVEPLKDKLRKFKFNTELFNTLLTDQPKFVIPDKDWSIVLGNSQAPNIITMVSNPYCNPCTTVHQSLKEWLNSTNNIQVRIIFSVSNNEADKRRILAAHLMALDAIGNNAKTEKALSEWYDKKNYVSWAKNYPVNNIDEAIFDKLKIQADWCDITEIKATPTILVNGYKLPALYQIADLKYMLQ